MHTTPFHKFHHDHLADMVACDGWHMPLNYGSANDEHHCVRRHGGLFDISHLGRIEVSGRHARRLLERLLARRISDLAEHACRYSVLCNEQGGIIDDVTVYRLPNRWWLVVNAASRPRVLDHIASHIGALSARIVDRTFETAMIAIQGPDVMTAIGRFSAEVPALPRHGLCIKDLLVLKLTISRTGYTGEDGVEVVLPAGAVDMALRLLMPARSGPADATLGLRPAGLAARETLRQEAGFVRYGYEIDEQMDPLSAGLQATVSLDKDQDARGEPFIGQAALQRIATDGPSRRRVGLHLEGSAPAEPGQTVCRGDRPAGRITSSCVSPTLGRPIAMCLVDAAHATAGTLLQVTSSNGTLGAMVVDLPFYKRA